MKIRTYATSLLMYLAICNILYGQDTAKVKMLVDSADLVCVGRVIEDIDLLWDVPNEGPAFDGTVYRIEVERTLKGGMQNAAIEIFSPLYGYTYISDRITLDKFHRYLLLLDPTSVDESIKQRYGLKGAVYFSINFCEDMDKERGRSFLWQAEQYLGLPHISYEKINALSLLDSFIVNVQVVVNRGGDSAKRFCRRGYASFD